ncbi:D-tagatose-bisphosphate aldolase, class II, non-catalytic subunit [Rhizosaccharibacter radicis]|uniref:D-tagatose-bisphosphate aldolase, class II, non-catalytic subunit n=1 Tax=Rhizosaccharibacter radicis TaxID=2782605 RepID=A0ABT1VXY7_9PROT|nr:D-tagatose-bisphosphate aldolase, class II, non-catalytic subunit [Acetobacteraceae bacterium KSS12]
MRPDDILRTLRARRDAHSPLGITSVCSAHELVIEAALRQAAADDTPALIEATCNQVNQEGGYTGMTPADFRTFVEGIADRIGFPRHGLILGGDHLGPNPWRRLPAAEAMDKAVAMIDAYARAGFTKLHLDASMGCAGEAEAPPDAVIAKRAARLARAADAAAGAEQPFFIIGTEVPTPGGATHALDHLVPTAPDAVLATYRVHEEEFRRVAPDAWSRVIAIVVQPGVEFGHQDVVIYRPDEARALVRTLDRMPGLVFEAHSTDYQPEAALAGLVRDGFPILKVGPGLTFALREAIYGLDAIAAVLRPCGGRIEDAMEELMLAEPGNWRSHYPGTPAEQRVLRHYSLSDRIRYYWPAPAARQAVDALLSRLDGVAIPLPLISQFLPRLHDRVASGTLPAQPRALMVEAVRDVLRCYARACAPA